MHGTKHVNYLSLSKKRIHFFIRLIYFWWLILLVVHWTDAESSTSSHYQSAVALDQFGNSVQLRNARECSLRHGLPIIAAQTTEPPSIVVCSLHPNLSEFDGRTLQQQKHERLVHILACDDLECPETITALVCSGLKADAVFLRSLLREKSRCLWERYDIIPSPSQMADACSQVFLSFFKYNRQKEVNDETGPLDSYDDKSLDMSRPFGLHALVLGTDRTSVQKILSVDPSGTQRRHDSFIAIGRESKEANKKMKQLWRNDMTIDEIKEMCTTILNEFKQNEDDVVCVEILSPAHPAA